MQHQHQQQALQEQVAKAERYLKKVQKEAKAAGVATHRGKRAYARSIPQNSQSEEDSTYSSTSDDRTSHTAVQSSEGEGNGY